jgi:NAD(P)-dependent dehydrogenase (short-subunit alcohol dehydrogenase family)
MERTIVVTGAGSGIGLATAIEAAGLGFDVVGTVHHVDQVDRLERHAREAGARVAVEVMDVTDDARAREVIERHAPWGLVNIAGLMLPGLVAETPLEDAERHFDVMVTAPMRLAQLALPAMRRDGGGRIVNVSSIAGDVNGPLLGWYEAAKQALSSVSDALRPEVAGYGVEVVLVEPGPYATPLWDKARDYLARLPGIWCYLSLVDPLSVLGHRSVVTGPEKIAESVLGGRPQPRGQRPIGRLA